MFLNYYKAVIFDMDGLLLDTERISLDTFRDTCREFNYEPDTEVYLKCVGTNDARTKEIIIDAFGDDFPYQAISQVWFEKYRCAVQDHPIPVKEGAKDFLEFIQESPLKIALATSTNHQMAREKLKNAGLTSFFQTIVGGDQVAQSKPAPEIYLKAARLINVSPTTCLALEDSDNGVTAAYRAGMTVIQIPDLQQPSPEVRAFGHKIFSSLKETRTFLSNEAAVN